MAERNSQNGSEKSKVLSPEKYDAVLFDMDGVVTRTASVHFAAWKKTFDSFIKETNPSRFSEE